MWCCNKYFVRLIIVFVSLMNWGFFSFSFFEGSSELKLTHDIYDIILTKLRYNISGAIH